MINRRSFALSLILAGTPSAFSKSGPPIPAPFVSISDAVAKVEKHFAANYKEAAKLKFVAMQAEYVDGLVEQTRDGPKLKPLDAWSWRVVMRSLLEASSSYVFILTPQGEVKLVDETI